MEEIVVGDTTGIEVGRTAVDDRRVDGGNEHQSSCIETVNEEGASYTSGGPAMIVVASVADEGALIDDGSHVGISIPEVEDSAVGILTQACRLGGEVGSSIEISGNNVAISGSDVGACFRNCEEALSDDSFLFGEHTTLGKVSPSASTFGNVEIFNDVGRVGRITSGRVECLAANDVALEDTKVEKIPSVEGSGRSDIEGVTVRQAGARSSGASSGASVSEGDSLGSITTNPSPDVDGV